MSYLARVTYTGNGSTTGYALPFSYIASSHVFAYLDNVNTTAFTIAGSTLTFTTAPSSGVVITLKRITPSNARLVDFTDGSVLTEADLDQSADQNFFLSQETKDDGLSTIQLTNADVFDALSKRIINVANPTGNNDAVNKTYLENTWLSTSDKSNITTLSAQASKIALLGTSDAIADMNVLATADIISDINTLATSDIVADLNTLASSDIVTDMNTLATSANVTAMGLLGNSTTVTNMGLLGTSDAVADMNTLATSDIVSDLNTLATSANVTAMGLLGTSANVTAMGLLGTSAVVTDLGILATADVVADMNVLATADVVADMNTLGTADVVSDMNTLGTSANVTAMSNVSSNIAGVNSFADRYRVQAGVPSSSLNVGDLNFDTTANELKVYKSSGWASAGSTVNGTSARFTYTATANQTTFTGADNNGSTLAYDASFIDCYLNGVKLINGTDVTVTSGNSIVLATGATVGDTLDLVGFGTFNVASIAGTAINSGTINDARLPTTMAGKTLTTATVTGTINANTLIAKGDGSSADGKITLNCSQNTHGVKIQSPAHSSAQDYTLVLPTSVGTNGQVLATNGNATNQLSWVNAVETKPTISSGNLYIAPSTGVTFTLTGANFVSIPIVEFITSTGGVTRATAVAFTNAGSLNITTNLANGAYKVRVENPDGNAGISSGQIINASSAPTWSTAQALGTFAGNASGTLVTLSASSDSTVSYAEVGSNLTTGNMTLSGANITTTDFGGSSTTPTQYTFTIRATDAEGQYLDRTFTINSSFGATNGGQFN